MAPLRRPLDFDDHSGRAGSVDVNKIQYAGLAWKQYRMYAHEC